MFASRTNWILTPNRLSQAIAERRRAGLELLDLTESNPTRCGFAPPAEVLSPLADPRALIYEPDPRGLLRAREAVCAYYSERGTRVSPEQVFLATSTSEAYSYVFRLLADPGDHVLIPQPSYPLFDFLAGLNDLEAVSYPLRYYGQWQIDLESVTNALGPRAKVMVVVHSNNPTGSYIKKNELSLLSRACIQNQTALIADEVFADYALGKSSDTVASHAGESQILSFTLSGLSKICALPQMKLGWMVVNGPPELLRTAMARLEVIADTYLSVSAPLAHALPQLLGRSRKVQAHITERLQKNLLTLDESLGSLPSVRRLKIEGGWYAILQIPSTRGDEEWSVEFLTQDGVLVHPGHFYDFATEGYLIVSLLTGQQIFREGIARVLARIAKSG